MSFLIRTISTMPSVGLGFGEGGFVVPGEGEGVAVSLLGYGSLSGRT